MIFRWEFDAPDMVAEWKGFANVVRVLHWRYVAIEGDGADAVSVGISGSTPLPLPREAGAYASFETLSEEWCIEQVAAFLDLEEVQKQLAGMLEQQRQKRRLPFVEAALQARRAALQGSAWPRPRPPGYTPPAPRPGEEARAAPLSSARRAPPVKPPIEGAPADES